MSELLLDRADRRRSPATMPGSDAGHAPGSRGLRYPAEPPKVEEIVAVMRAADDRAHGRRLRVLIAILWRSGCVSGSARAHRRRPRSPPRVAPWSGAARAGRRREAGMDVWGLGADTALARDAAGAAGRSPVVRHQRHAPRTPRHSNLGITSVYLQGDSGEIIETVHARRAPMIAVSGSLRLSAIPHGVARRAKRHSRVALREWRSQANATAGSIKRETRRGRSARSRSAHASAGSREALHPLPRAARSVPGRRTGLRCRVSRIGRS
jgi:hypothetical protein